MSIQSPALISFDFRSVILSGLVLIIAAYATFALRERLKSAQGASLFAWLCGGASVIGIGNWSMHYLGLKALGLPMPTLNNSTVALSIVATIFASGVALLVVSGKSDSGRGVKAKETTPSSHQVSAGSSSVLHGLPTL
jgi:NO-binding membrane sensor protein with MHYT domain